MSDITVRSILLGIVLGGGVILMVEISLWYWRTAAPWITEKIKDRMLRREREILAEYEDFTYNIPPDIKLPTVDEVRKWRDEGGSKV